MKGTGSFFMGLLLVFGVFAGNVLAGEKGLLEIKTIAQQEIEKFNEEGKKIVARVPAAKVIPGDVVIYTISFRNISDKTAENAFITNPVPQHMHYVDGSAVGEGSEITFSTDGGATFAAPDALTINLPNGGARPAIASDYTHIRWKVAEPLAPGASGEVGYRAKLQ